MTFNEVSLFLDGYKEKRILEIKEETELIAVATKIGFVNAMGKNDFKVFSERIEEKTNLDSTYKEKTIENLKKTFKL